jgi:ABC-type antimicrobial peptide transport system permease subunit
MVFSGILVGLAGAAALSQLLARFLLLTSPTDPLTFVLVTMTIGLVVLLACYVPARRAMRVQPVEALRHE